MNHKKEDVRDLETPNTTNTSSQLEHAILQFKTIVPKGYSITTEGVFNKNGKICSPFVIKEIIDGNSQLFEVLYEDTDGNLIIDTIRLGVIRSFKKLPITYKYKCGTPANDEKRDFLKYVKESIFLLRQRKGIQSGYELPYTTKTTIGKHGVRINWFVGQPLPHGYIIDEDGLSLKVGKNGNLKFDLISRTPLTITNVKESKDKPGYDCAVLFLNANKRTRTATVHQKNLLIKDIKYFIADMQKAGAICTIKDSRKLNKYFAECLAERIKGGFE